MSSLAAERLRVKRAYEAPTDADGCRVVVERLWPRGLRKADAAIDVWLKDIAPSTELREWYSHDVARWPEFKRRYQTELRANLAVVDDLVSRARRGTVTLIYAAHDEEHNSALVLRGFLARRLR
ncbi:MAG: DUF488 family protein [Candidatus Eremiobacteraeota bacterium]|nr:DUF488 family protein [Candidatus Eremiobacteraeota bacterium]MBC5804797.1 DUF488 family protein [Candidatus Eremiobacteraeota bacterium]MBC5825045.1 DUF488 family protein [Candidatus Eremiobacteraeota bacterium]